jgi:hypothetical protein
MFTLLNKTNSPSLIRGVGQFPQRDVADGKPWDNGFLRRNVHLFLTASRPISGALLSLHAYHLLVHPRHVYLSLFSLLLFDRNRQRFIGAYVAASRDGGNSLGGSLG